MINIDVWSEKYVEIEGRKFEINNKLEFIHFIKVVLDKAYYSGERICLEEVSIEDGQNKYDEINRW